MTKLIEKDHRLEAWAEAADLILAESDNSLQDIILHVSNPHKEHELTEEVFNELDDMYEKVGQPPIHSVAEWIFPYSLYRKEGMDGVYDTYPEQMETFQSVTRWGTYAQRLISRTDPETDEEYNPLKRVIDKLSYSHQEGNPTYQSCYEFGFQVGPCDIPLYDPAKDRNRYFGGPCLMHISIKLFNENIHLTAFYRSHEYRFKVPGNLLGLARLQECVAQETDTGIGNLVIHSSRAFVDNEGGTSDFTDLIRGLQTR